MALLAASFIILASISQNYFYINHQNYVQDAFVCFSIQPLNGSCENWPDNWKRLQTKTINNRNLNVFQTKLDDDGTGAIKNASILFYKLKFYYMDQTVGESHQWNTVVVNDKFSNVWWEKCSEQKSVLTNLENELSINCTTPENNYYEQIDKKLGALQPYLQYLILSGISVGVILFCLLCMVTYLHVREILAAKFCRS